MQRPVSQAQQREYAYLGSKEIGKIVTTEFGQFYVDIALNPFQRNQSVFLFIDDKGNLEPIFEGMFWKGKYYIKRETEGLPPSRILWSFRDFVEVDAVKLNEAFELAKEVLEDTVVFKDKKIYDLVIAWCMYSWLRGLFPKNINLYFIGFPATGKSQALKFVKKFGRYVVDYDPSAEKSFKWNISYTLGVLAIDEAEYITKMKASKLRKYHEAGVIETRLIGLPLVGLTPIDLRVDAPLVLSATHPPSDTAFLQRGFIIRMLKGSPKIKDFDLIPDLQYRTRVFAKTVLVNWSKVWESLNRVYFQLSFKNIDERIKDLALPIVTILEALGKDWEWVIDFAKYSFVQANFITPETTAFLQSLLLITREADIVKDKYILSVSKVMEIIAELGKMLGTQPGKLDYLKQYLFAGCEIGIVNKKLCYICDKKTVDTLLENLSVLEVENNDTEIALLQQKLKGLGKLELAFLKALKSFIVENNFDYKSGNINVSVKDIKAYIRESSYRRLSVKGFMEKFRTKFINNGVPEWLNLLGVVRITDSLSDIVLTIDLEKIKDKLDLIDKITKGENRK